MAKLVSVLISVAILAAVCSLFGSHAVFMTVGVATTALFFMKLLLLEDARKLPPVSGAEGEF